jgi:predicted TIM-barrel fold metal-dependent hydrolase
VATIETSADQIPRVVGLADELPELRIVLDHFGWPSDLGADGRRAHFDALRPLADRANVAARLDALGTIFASWDVETVRPWLRGVVEIFGCDRCMFGSDMPIETLRSTFGDLRRAYDDIFDGRSDDERRQLFHDTALHWLGARS